jgi:hypothetical protein
LLFLKILGAVLALGAGLYFGGAGQYRPDYDEIDKSLGEGGVTRRTRRHFTLFGWLRQNQERGSSFRRRTRGASTRRFNLSSPDSKKD